MNDESVVEEPWAGYLSLQNELRNRTVVNHTLWALEDKADAFLDAIERDSVPPAGDRREGWLRDIQGNRNRKHRNRLRLTEEYARHITISAGIRNQLDRLIERERLIQVRNSTTAQEFRILVRRALDHPYTAIAPDEDLTVGSLKAKVCRCRHRLQSHLGLPTPGASRAISIKE